jgi:thymidylate synthase
MKEYLELLQDILDNGREKESGRANMPNTFGLSRGTILMKDIQNNFPLLTTKKMFWKGIVHELLWFLRGETNIKYLVDNKVNIWNGDAYRYFKERLWLLPDVESITMEEFLVRVKEERKEENFHYVYGDLGPVYGHQWRNHNGFINYFQIGKKPNIDVSNHKTFGFGNKGETKGVKSHPLFQTWSNMISRCYNYNDPSFSKYGGKGVYVSDDWLFFDNFKEDAKKIMNYGLKENNPNEYQLDKDFLGGKYYSKETCVWLNVKENASLHSNNIVYVISNEVDTITTDNIEGTAKKLGIEPTNLNRVCNGKRKTADGWYLISKQDNNVGVDQIAEIIRDLKNNPMGRYKILDAWNPKQRKICALAPCHLLYQFIVRPMTLEERLKYKENLNPGKNPGYELGRSEDYYESYCDNLNIPKFFLDVNMYQRSVDTALGCPYNIASMSLLLMIIAKTVGMVAGDAFWIGGDTHIYVNHIDGIKEQLKRNTYDLPQIKINKKLESLDDILELTIDDFELINYVSHPTIKYELSVGLPKNTNI